MSDFIDEIIQREGGSAETNDSSDSGGRTKYGISEKANPEVWADGDVTYDEARNVYEQKYVKANHLDFIPNTTLQHQVVDLGVTSGPDTSASLLQQLVGTAVDGTVGPKTIDAIQNYPAGTLFGFPVPGYVLLNLAFRDARTLFYVTLAKKRPKDLKYVLGWVKRTQEFK